MTLAEAVDATGAKFQVRGYAVSAMENEDKTYIRYQGMGSANGETVTGEGTWAFTGEPASSKV